MATAPASTTSTGVHHAAVAVVAAAVLALLQPLPYAALRAINVAAGGGPDTDTPADAFAFFWGQLTWWIGIAAFAVAIFVACGRARSVRAKGWSVLMAVCAYVLAALLVGLVSGGVSADLFFWFVAMSVFVNFNAIIGAIVAAIALFRYGNR